LDESEEQFEARKEGTKNVSLAGEGYKGDKAESGTDIGNKLKRAYL
jgi:hypothetical protein